jgi:Right handed beta helix region
VSILHALRRPMIAAVMAVMAITAVSATSAPTQAAVACERTFTGDPTGSRDVTSSLTSFIRNHGSRRLCLRPNASYRVDGIVRIEGVNGLRLNGRNATLKQVSTTSAGSNRRHLYLERATNIYIYDLNLRGRNPDVTRWVSSRQHEPGIWIDGGRRITLRDIGVSNTYGDGVYVGFKSGNIAPATDITLDLIRVTRAGRSGISITAGNHITISNALINDTALHGINLEPDYASADIHHVTVRNSTVNRVQRSGTQHGYAFAANGKVGDMDQITVRDNKGSRFEATIYAKPGYTHSDIVFVRNRSSVSTTARFGNVDGLTFSGNVNIRATRSNVR